MDSLQGLARPDCRAMEMTVKHAPALLQSRNIWGVQRSRRARCWGRRYGSSRRFAAALTPAEGWATGMPHPGGTGQLMGASA
jgi:hypothetical protein